MNAKSWTSGFFCKGKTEPNIRYQCREAETKEEALFEKNEGAGLNLRDKIPRGSPSALYLCAVSLPLMGLPWFRLSEKWALHIG